MRLLIAIVHDDDAKKLMRALTDAKLGVTKLASTGGFLHGGNTTLLIGVDNGDTEKALGIIEEYSCTRKVFMPSPATTLSGGAHIPIEVTVGGATVFVLEASAFHKF